MIDTFNDLTFERFNTEKKEIMEEHIHYNEQDMNNDRELLEIKNFLESDGWSLIPQNQIRDIDAVVNIRNNFLVKKKTRGRTRKKKSEKVPHGNKSFDNVQRKIQVHFLNFVISFCNDALKYYFKKLLFFF